MKTIPKRFTQSLVLAAIKRPPTANLYPVLWIFRATGTASIVFGVAIKESVQRVDRIEDANPTTTVHDAARKNEWLKREPVRDLARACPSRSARVRCKAQNGGQAERWLMEDLRWSHTVSCSPSSCGIHPS